MKDRIRKVRESLTDETGKKLSQAKFAQRLGVSVSSVQKWEIGAAVPNSTALAVIAEKCGISEAWLRTGHGDMQMDRNRAEQTGELVKRWFSDRPESFCTTLVSVLLSCDPEGPEWAALEQLYEKIAEKYQKTESREP